MKSLLQQRQALNRDRIASLVTSISGVIFILLGVAQLTLGGNLILWWFQVALGLIALVFGIVMRVRNQHQISNFELAHGVDAGKQVPLK
jgi:hypothetical protein